MCTICFLSKCVMYLKYCIDKDLNKDPHITYNHD